jgi:hypothetical protein
MHIFPAASDFPAFARTCSQETDESEQKKLRYWNNHIPVEKFIHLFMLRYTDVKGLWSLRLTTVPKTYSLGNNALFSIRIIATMRRSYQVARSWKQQEVSESMINSYCRSSPAACLILAPNSYSKAGKQPPSAPGRM